MNQSATILCVDDQAVNLRIRKQLLELKGYLVVIATDHQSALNVIKNAHVDLAIIDYHLAQRETGEQVTKDLKASIPDLSIIMLSGDPNIPQSARECVDSVFIKGQSEPADLLNTMEKLLGSRRGSDSSER